MSFILQLAGGALQSSLSLRPSIRSFSVKVDVPDKRRHKNAAKTLAKAFAKSYGEKVGREVDPANLSLECNGTKLSSDATCGELLDSQRIMICVRERKAPAARAAAPANSTTAAAAPSAAAPAKSSVADAAAPAKKPAAAPARKPAAAPAKEAAAPAASAAETWAKSAAANWAPPARKAAPPAPAAPLDDDARRCEACGAAPAKPLRCSACNAGTFCGRACFRRAWPAHRERCAASKRTPFRLPRDDPMVRGFSPADLLELARGPCPADERAAIKRELHRWPDAAFWAGVFEMDPVDMRAPASRREFRGGKTTRVP